MEITTGMFIIIMASLILTSSLIFISQKVETETNTKLHQGPVPEGYDEGYFRKTGITKPIEDDGGSA